MARGLAEHAQRVIILHVIEDEELEAFGETIAHNQARDKLEALAERMPISRDKLTLELRQGTASREIKRIAREQAATTVIIGKRGHSPVRELMLGSTAQAIVMGATQSVLIVPGRLGRI